MVRKAGNKKKQMLSGSTSKKLKYRSDSSVSCVSTTKQICKLDLQPVKAVTDDLIAHNNPQNMIVEEIEGVLHVKRKRKRSVPLVDDELPKVSTTINKKQFPKIKLLSENKESLNNELTTKIKKPSSSTAGPKSKKKLDFNLNKMIPDSSKNKVNHIKKAKLKQIDHSTTVKDNENKQKEKENSSKSPKKLRVSMSTKSPEKQTLIKEDIRLEERDIKSLDKIDEVAQSSKKLKSICPKSPQKQKYIKEKHDHTTKDKPVEVSQSSEQISEVNLKKKHEIRPNTNQKNDGSSNQDTQKSSPKKIIKKLRKLLNIEDFTRSPKQGSPNVTFKKDTKKNSHKRIKDKMHKKTKPNIEVQPSKEFATKEELINFKILQKYSKLYNCSFEPVISLERITDQFAPQFVDNKFHQEENELTPICYGWDDCDEEIDIKFEPLHNDDYSDQCELYNESLQAKFDSETKPLLVKTESPTNCKELRVSLEDLQKLTSKFIHINRDFNYDNYRIRRHNKNKFKYSYVPKKIIETLTSHDRIFRNATLVSNETINLGYPSATIANLNVRHQISTTNTCESIELETPKSDIAISKKKTVKLSIKKVADTGEWRSEIRESPKTDSGVDIATPSSQTYFIPTNENLIQNYIDSQEIVEPILDNTIFTKNDSSFTPISVDLNKSQTPLKKIDTAHMGDSRLKVPIVLNFKDNNYMEAPNIIEKDVQSASTPTSSPEKIRKVAELTTFNVVNSTRSDSMLKTKTCSKWTKKINACIDDAKTSCYTSYTELPKEINTTVKTESSFAARVVKDSQQSAQSPERIETVVTFSPRNKSRFKVPETCNSEENYSEYSERTKTVVTEFPKQLTIKTKYASFADSVAENFQENVLPKSESKYKMSAINNYNQDYTDSSHRPDRDMEIANRTQTYSNVKKLTNKIKILNDSKLAITPNSDLEYHIGSPETVTSITPIPSESNFALSPVKDSTITSVATPVIVNLKDNYMKSPQNVSSVTPMRSESNLRESFAKIPTLPSDNSNFEGATCVEMRRDSNVSLDSRRKHTFKFDNSAVKRPPTRKSISINRPIISTNEFKVPSPVKPSRPKKSKYVPPVYKSDDFDVISIYADTIANKSVCDAKSVRLSLSDDEDIDENSETLRNMPFNENNSCNVGIDVKSWVLKTAEYKPDPISPLHSVPKTCNERIGIDDEQQVVNESPMNKPKLVSPPNVEHYQSMNNPVKLQSQNAINNKTDLPKIPTLLSNTVTQIPRYPKIMIPPVFKSLCPNVKFNGECHWQKCLFDHSFRQGWQAPLQSLSVHDLMLLYKSIKDNNELFLFKKIFSTIAEQLGVHKDYNCLVSLVKDVLTIKMNSDRTPFVHDIIKGLCTTGVTFHSTVELIYKNACVSQNLQNLLGDILLNITVENGNLEENWSVIQMLIIHNDCSVDGGVIHNILVESFKENKAQKELCLKVYCDLIQKLPDETLFKITDQVLKKYIETLRKMNLIIEADKLSARYKSYNNEHCIPKDPCNSAYIAEPQNTYLKPLLDTYPVSPAKLIQSCPPLKVLDPPRPLLNQQYIPPPPVQPFKIPLLKYQNSNWHNNNRPIHNVAPANFKQPLELHNIASTSRINFNTSVPPPAIITRSPPVPSFVFSEEKIRQAIYNRNVGDMMSLIMNCKDTNWTDAFLKISISALIHNANFTSFFTTICQSAAVLGRDTLHRDKPLQYIFKTLSMNLILYLANAEKWQEAHFIYTTIIKLYNFNDDIINVKLYLKDTFSLTKRLLVLARMHLRKHDFKTAWDYLKEHALGTGQYWKLAEREDYNYKNDCLCDYLSKTIKHKQWALGLLAVQYFLSNNFHEIELKPYLDDLLLVALNSNCPTDTITNITNCTADWYVHVNNNTFRAIVIKLFTNGYRTRALSLYKTGVQLDIYPNIIGNERVIEFQTHFLFEEIQLMLDVFFQNMVNFIPVNYSVEIRAAQGLVNQGSDLPSLLYQPVINFETMRVRIVNILNNYIKPPVMVLNKNNTLIIDHQQLQTHLEVRSRK